jgi:aspartate racemase
LGRGKGADATESAHLKQAKSQKMKTLGLIGGIGPESTVEYYRGIIADYRGKAGGAYPSVFINSVDLQSLLKWMAMNQLDRVTDYLAREIEKLAKAGADFAALASNTPHIVFGDLQRRAALPLISIVEAACERVRSLGLKTVGLFGTRYTMQARFYPDVFERAGITLVVPDAEEQAYIHEKYLEELLKDIFLPETRTRLLAIADTLKDRHAIEGLILGGTELPLLLRDSEHNGIRLLDTTRIHVDRLVAELMT